MIILHSPLKGANVQKVKNNSICEWNEENAVISYLMYWLNIKHLSLKLTYKHKDSVIFFIQNSVPFSTADSTNV